MYPGQLSLLCFLWLQVTETLYFLVQFHSVPPKVRKVFSGICFSRVTVVLTTWRVCTQVYGVSIPPTMTAQLTKVLYPISTISFQESLLSSLGEICMPKLISPEKNLELPGIQGNLLQMETAHFVAWILTQILFVILGHPSSTDRPIVSGRLFHEARNLKDSFTSVGNLSVTFLCILQNFWQTPS